VQVHVGFDQTGRTVDLVKRAEALAAVVANDESAIFRPEVIKKAGVPAVQPGAKGAKAEAASIVEGEKKRTVEDRTAAKAKLARELEAAKWLTELQLVLEKPYPVGNAKSMAESYVFWALLFDLQLEALTDEDLEFLKAVGLPWYEPEQGAIREQWKAWAGGFKTNDLAALVAIMQLVPRVRAEGTESALVREWHQQLMVAAPLAESDTEENEVDPEVLVQIKDDEDAAKFAAEQLAVMRADLEAAFEAAGIKSTKERNRVTKLKCGGLKFDELTSEEHFRAVLGMLKAGKGETK
jgi:hypothetical protein